MLHYRCTRTVVVTILTALSLIFLLSLEAISAPQTLPFNASFEDGGDSYPSYVIGALSGQHGWESSDNSVVVQSATKYLGTRAVEVPEGSGTTNTFSGAPKKAWNDLYARITHRDPTLTSDPSVDPDATAFFFFNSNGYPRVYYSSLADFVTLKNDEGGAPITPFPDDSFIRVTVFKNYNSQKWALFLDDQLIDEQIPFANFQGSFSSAAIRNKAYIDSFWVGDYFPTSGDLNGPLASSAEDSDGDGSGDVWEIHYFDSANIYGSGQDPDNDGKLNEEEFAQDTDPTLASSVIWDVPYLARVSYLPGSVVRK